MYIYIYITYVCVCVWSFFWVECAQVGTFRYCFCLSQTMVLTGFLLALAVAIMGPEILMAPKRYGGAWPGDVPTWCISCCRKETRWEYQILTHDAVLVWVTMRLSDITCVMMCWSGFPCSEGCGTDSIPTQEFLVIGAEKLQGVCAKFHIFP